jgi:3-oxoacyl-[acyl-carrier-protein] synthase-3
MLYLHGLGHFFPDNIITNQFIEALDIGSDAQWIMERVGIQTRRTTLSLDYIRDTRNRDPRAAVEASVISRARAGAEASRMALTRAGLNASDIGMVISGSSTANFSIPAEASIIASELNIEAPCFDVNSACSTFVLQLAFLNLMESRATPPFILVINPENCTHVVDYSDRSTAPLFGDGFSAAVVSASITISIFRLWFSAIILAKSQHSFRRTFSPGRAGGSEFCHKEDDGFHATLTDCMRWERKQNEIHRAPGQSYDA